MKNKNRIAVALLAAFGFACGTDWGPATLAEGAASADFSQLEHGRQVYATYCIGCHGEQGDGNGASSRFMDPKPRDFGKCKVKFASVASGEIPRDEDYADTLRHGLAGTAMPGFPLLAERDMRAVVSYLRSFCAKDKPPGQALQFGSNPWLRRPDEGVAEGEKVYHAIGRCWSCHPAYISRQKIAGYLQEMDMPAGGFRDGLYESVSKDSDWGEPILPPDFLYHRTKTGNSAERLVRAIGAGIGGTAMPTWVGGLNNRQLWGLGMYLEGVVAMRGTSGAKALRQELADQPAYVAPPAPPAPEGEEQ